MKRVLLAAVLALPLTGCLTVQEGLNLANDLIARGERDLAILCAQVPAAAPVVATQMACIARANGTAQTIVAAWIAGAQSICAGTTAPPSVASALSQLRRAATAAANAQAAGCQ
jgi:hypothetical protein